MGPRNPRSHESFGKKDNIKTCKIEEPAEVMMKEWFGTASE
jgi:hypothetical protein